LISATQKKIDRHQRGRFLEPGLSGHQAELGQREGGADIRVGGERQLAARGKDAHLRHVSGVARWQSPVSHPRSSNRTCGFPASGFPTGFVAGTR